MMQLSQDANHAKYQIKAHEPGRVQINEEIYTSSVLILPEKIVADWPPQTADAISPEHIQYFVQNKDPRYPLEIVLIGTGEQQMFLPAATLAALYERRIGVEVMSTPAACRTYSVLSAEGRRVAVGLVL